MISKEEARATTIDSAARDVVATLRDPQVTSLLRKQGVEPSPGTPEELARYMEREYQTWGRVVKQAGIKAQ